MLSFSLVVFAHLCRRGLIADLLSARRAVSVHQLTANIYLGVRKHEGHRRCKWAVG